MKGPDHQTKSNMLICHLVVQVRVSMCDVVAYHGLTITSACLSACKSVLGTRHTAMDKHVPHRAKLHHKPADSDH